MSYSKLVQKPDFASLPLAKKQQLDQEAKVFVKKVVDRKELFLLRKIGVKTHASIEWIIIYSKEESYRYSLKIERFLGFLYEAELTGPDSRY